MPRIEATTKTQLNAANTISMLVGMPRCQYWSGKFRRSSFGSFVVWTNFFIESFRCEALMECSPLQELFCHEVTLRFTKRNAVLFDVSPKGHIDSWDYMMSIQSSLGVFFVGFQPAYGTAVFISFEDVVSKGCPYLFFSFAHDWIVFLLAASQIHTIFWHRPRTRKQQETKLAGTRYITSKLQTRRTKTVSLKGLLAAARMMSPK